jgi:hypothetical protein
MNFYELENISNYEKWYYNYIDNLKDMYYILIKNLKDNNIKYKNIDFFEFCIFVYKNTSKYVL